jgi:transcription termination factor NusB
MGAWELRYRPSVQISAVINHCVELARRLSTEKSAEFVNAVLDALSKAPSQSSTGSAS